MTWRQRARCAVCADLEAQGRAPELRLTTGSLALYRLIEHCIDAHDAVGFFCVDCVRCADLARRGPIKERLRVKWERHHHVMHQLGIVEDGAGHPLRFADMPEPAVERSRRAWTPLDVEARLGAAFDEMAASIPLDVEAGLRAILDP
jgi:hypothetical protein